MTKWRLSYEQSFDSQNCVPVGFKSMRGASNHRFLWELGMWMKNPSISSFCLLTLKLGFSSDWEPKIWRITSSRYSIDDSCDWMFQSIRSGIIGTFQEVYCFSSRSWSTHVTWVRINTGASMTIYWVYTSFWPIKNRHSFSPRKANPILKKDLNRSWCAVFLGHQFFVPSLLNMPTMQVWRKRPYPACIFNQRN